MIETECSNCGSSSFLHQDSGRERLSREEAISKREGKKYDERPKAKTSESWSSDSKSLSSSHINDPNSLSQNSHSVLTAAENELNAEIAEIVTQIEILDRRLQELLSQRSPEIRKMNEERERKVTARAIKASGVTSAAASGISDVIGELFSS